MNTSDEKEVFIKVPEAWLKILLVHAQKAEQEMANNESHGFDRTRTAMLIGYAKSADTLIKHGEREERPK